MCLPGCCWPELLLLQRRVPWLLLGLVCRSETRTHTTAVHQPWGYLADTALAMHVPSLMLGMLWKVFKLGKKKPHGAEKRHFGG